MELTASQLGGDRRGKRTRHDAWGLLAVTKESITSQHRSALDPRVRATHLELDVADVWWFAVAVQRRYASLDLTLEPIDQLRNIHTGC